VIVLHYAVSPIQFGSLLDRSPFYCKSSRPGENLVF
jgi:hypothetical protein